MNNSKKGILGTDSIFPFLDATKIKNIEYKEMKRFCVSKFEFRNY